MGPLQYPGELHRARIHHHRPEPRDVAETRVEGMALRCTGIAANRNSGGYCAAIRVPQRSRIRLLDRPGDCRGWRLYHHCQMALRALISLLLLWTALLAEERVEFVCPMDRDVRTLAPGKCPKCGMKLVAGLH